jgi:hypothetical protein
MKKLNFRDTTFIIPVRIESYDRMVNFTTSVSFLLKHLDCKIIIQEEDTEQRANALVKKIRDEFPSAKNNLQYIFKEFKSPEFHRTRILNEMLSLVDTEITVNFDCDIILDPNTHLTARNKIKDDGYDLVYPYNFGIGQIKIGEKGRDKLNKSLDLSVLDAFDGEWERAEYGHCQYFKTQSYRSGGMENEGFIGYAPEDAERAYRFQRLGYKVCWLPDHSVMHLEHSRTFNSSSENPHMANNNALFEAIKKMGSMELVGYYVGSEYLKKYR